MIKGLLEKLDQKDTTPYGGKGLFIMICCLLFTVPFLPVQYHRISYNLLFTAIFISAVLSLETGQSGFLKYVVIAIVTEWVAYFFDLRQLHILSKGINILFFFYVVFKLIVQIARAKEVTFDVILESINGYLLLGISFSLLIAIIHQFDHEAFSFGLSDQQLLDAISDFGEYLYFTFVTYATLGYGEIVPKAAYAKGAVILITVSGQLYLTILIAMLVGKFLSNNQK